MERYEVEIKGLHMSVHASLGYAQRELERAEQRHGAKGVINIERANGTIDTVTLSELR